MVSAKVIDKDLGYKRIVLNFRQLKGRVVKVGIMGDETNEGTSVVDYAVYNEFGTDRIPARPFMATTADANREKAVDFTEFLVDKIIYGELTVDRALRNLGEWYQAQIQMTIRNAKSWAVPDAPATVKAKGSSSPLIDQGRLVQAIRYEVMGGEPESTNTDKAVRVAAKLLGA